VLSLRRAVSDRLLRLGARLASDREEMWRTIQQSRVRKLGAGDLQVLGVLDLWSTTAIRLGMLIMPAGLPEFGNGPPEIPW
jgi:hypothetical protein